MGLGFNNHLWNKVLAILGILLSEIMVRLALGLHIYLWDKVKAVSGYVSYVECRSLHIHHLQLCLYYVRVRSPIWNAGQGRIIASHPLLV